MITYTSTADAITADQLRGFFVGWSVPPSPERHLELLRGSHAVELALDGDAVVGFATAISDGVMSVHPAARGLAGVSTRAHRQ